VIVVPSAKDEVVETSVMCWIPRSIGPDREWETCMYSPPTDTLIESGAFGGAIDPTAEEAVFVARVLTPSMTVCSN
jgi:hypothetical protein